jgi:hypothetical protein
MAEIGKDNQPQKVSQVKSENEKSMIDEIIQVMVEKKGKTEEEILAGWVREAQANPDDPNRGVYEERLSKLRANRQKSS